MDWAMIIGAGLGGGAIAKLFDYLIVKAKNNQEDENRMVKLLTGDNEQLRAERDIREGQVKALFEELMSLKQDYVTLKEDYIRMQARVATLEEDYGALERKLKEYEQ